MLGFFQGLDNLFHLYVQISSDKHESPLNDGFALWWGIEADVQLLNNCIICKQDIIPTTGIKNYFLNQT